MRASSLVLAFVLTASACVGQQADAPAPRTNGPPISDVTGRARTSQPSPSPNPPAAVALSTAPADAGRGRRCRVVGQLSSQRHNMLILSLADGRVLFIGGGFRDGADERKDVDVFDPKTDRVEPFPSLKVARIAPSGAVLPDGRIIVAGDDCSVEVYEPATNAFRILVPDAFGVAPERPLVAPLRGGKVLIAGGWVIANTGFPSMEFLVLDPSSPLQAKPHRFPEWNVERGPYRLRDDGKLVVTRDPGDDVVDTGFPRGQDCEVLFDATTLKWSDLKSCHPEVSEAGPFGTSGLSDSDVRFANGTGEHAYDHLLLDEHSLVFADCDTRDVVACAF